MNDPNDHRLVPCTGCSRHVRVRESACPFCGAALVDSGARVPSRRVVGRLSRAALVAFGAGAIGATACGTTVEPLYGAPSMGDDGAAGDSGEDSSTDGGPVALYGGPPVEAGADMGVGVLYGLPAFDASTGADTGSAAAYGGFPGDSSTD